MSKKAISHLFIILMVVAGFISSSAYAGSNFIAISLPHGVSVEIPRNWQAATNDQRITLDTAVESYIDLSKLPQNVSTLAFLAGYFDDKGDKAKVNVRYYPNTPVAQNDVRRFNPEEIREFDNAIRQSSYAASKAAGGDILSWAGTQKRDFTGHLALVTEYRRPPNVGEQGAFNVRLIRVFDGPRSFTLTVSYNESYAEYFKPICDRIISSLKIKK